ncbi:hypothetical protein G7Z17_g1197 [Cylindrodendrum hubeiense]|uniref:Uncharacterized protein n=1 Tax=Cylindrodendrum hubeiense TaxID=595255 RepID=A0A9P5HJZ8_9HYPO|nr:hypothetical protein G7Z17_g1197 [Cylindrodendrum hubeiense]
MASSDPKPNDRILPFHDKIVTKLKPSLLYYVYNPSDPLALHSAESLPSRETQILDVIKTYAEHRPLGHYCYDLEMPLMLSPEGSPMSCRETLEEFEPVNAHFSAQVHALFNALKACEDSTTESNIPILHKDGLNLCIKLGLQSYDIGLECWHRTLHSRRLFLTNAAALPALSSVTKLEIDTDHSYEISFDRTRPVSLRVPLELTLRLPALQELDCSWLWERTLVPFESPELRRYTREWEGPWRDSRHEFARAVDELHEQIPISLRKARIYFWKSRYAFNEDQGIAMPNLVYPADEDPISAGLRTLTSHLEELDLRAFLTPDLFKSPVQWPRMRHLRIEFHPCRPDGSWYFVGPRDENPHPEGFEVTDDHYPPTSPNKEDEELDEEWDQNWAGTDDHLPDMFRTEPLADRIEPLLSAFAIALKDMPALEEAALFTQLSWTPSEERLAQYGDEAPYDAEYGGRRWGLRYVPGKDGVDGLVEWQVGAWRPHEDVIKLFEDLGSDGKVKMVWKPFDFMNWCGDYK